MTFYWKLICQKEDQHDSNLRFNQCNSDDELTHKFNWKRLSREIWKNFSLIYLVNVKAPQSETTITLQATKLSFLFPVLLELFIFTDLSSTVRHYRNNVLCILRVSFAALLTNNRDSLSFSPYFSFS